MIDGRPGTAPILDASATSVITWSPPALGTPTKYRLSLLGPGVSLDVTLPGDPAPRFVVPPGLLEPGASFVVRVSAIVSPVDPNRFPNRDGYPYGRADQLSQSVTVAR